MQLALAVEGLYFYGESHLDPHELSKLALHGDEEQVDLFFVVQLYEFIHVLALQVGL